MKHFIMVFSFLAFLCTITVTAAHACMDMPQDIAGEAMSHDHNASETNQKSSCDCDMTCGHACAHHHVMSYENGAFLLFFNGYKDSRFEESQVALGDLVYGLKRPPKS